LEPLLGIRPPVDDDAVRKRGQMLPETTLQEPEPDRARVSALEKDMVEGLILNAA
jgi:hypothetical protein